MSAKIIPASIIFSVFANFETLSICALAALLSLAPPLRARSVIIFDPSFVSDLNNVFLAWFAIPCLSWLSISFFLIGGRPIAPFLNIMSLYFTKIEKSSLTFASKQPISLANVWIISKFFLQSPSIISINFACHIGL